MRTNHEILKLANRMRYHVEIRGGARLRNGAWDMMLDASSILKTLAARRNMRRPKRLKNRSKLI